jgi:hypothetical protein
MWWTMTAFAQDLELAPAGERFRPTDEVLAALGAPDPTDKPEEIEWGAELNARLATDLECGAIKVDVDVEAMMDAVSDLPDQLATAGTSLASALPMLALCHLSPSICAEVKNLNLRIDQDLDFRAAMCNSIDKYIDEQADEGERIRRDAMKLAEQQCIQQAGGDAAAVRACTENPQSGLVTDIAQGFLGEKLASAPQKVVEAALDATNAELGKSPEFKQFLTGIVGEAEIGINGEVYPLLEPGSMTSEDIREALLYWGERNSCSPTRLATLVEGEDSPWEAEELDNPYESSEYAVERLEALLGERLTTQDLDNLGVLPWATWRAFCMGLKNTAARETALVLRDEVSALVIKAEGNPQLPSLGAGKLRQAMRTTEAVVASFADDSQIMDFAGWSAALAAAAASELGHQRAMAESLREAEQGNQRLWSNPAPCNSYLECLEGR